MIIMKIIMMITLTPPPPQYPSGVGLSHNKAYLDHLMSHILGSVLSQGCRGAGGGGSQANPYLPLVTIVSQSLVFALPTWLILQGDGETKVSCPKEGHRQRLWYCQSA